MEAALSETEQGWQRWLIARNRRGLRIALAFMATIYPAFGLLDWLIAPRSALSWLWATRALIAAAALATLPFMRHRAFDRFLDPVSVTHTVLSAAGIGVMTAYLGGLSSPYYAGFILIVVVVSLLFVWPPRLVVIAQSGIVGSFLASNLLLGTVGRPATALSNITFLSAAALIAGIGQVVLFRTHREQHLQRIQLEAATANLERAHTELRQIEQFKSRFFANMTHELRTPLATILAPLELMLEEGEVSEAQRSSFQTMYRSALKLLKLINDLLDLLRLDESRLRLAVAEHDLVEHLGGLVEETQVLAQRKGIAMRFRADRGRIPVWCDRERIERVVLNLLSNAIKFTPSGGRVAVSLSELPDAVELVVEDSGPGFPPEKAGKLFERFYQVDMAGTRQHGGAGIGLALAKELVLLHGGTIEAHSDGHSGARFRVTLQKGSRHIRADALATSDGPPAGREWTVELTARPDLRLIDIEEAAERRIVERDTDEAARPYTALIVEDNPNVVRVIHMALRRQFKVLIALDGVRGLELALRDRPNLVVTDLMMPGIDGLELTRRLRQDPRTSHVPVLMLSARGEIEDRVKGLEIGASAYLTKPFSARELLTCARQLVRAEEQTADRVLTHRMESLEMVAAGLAHEINNPLNYVKGALARVRIDVERAVALSGGGAGALPPAAQSELERLRTRLADLLGVADSGLKRIAGTVELMGRYGRQGFRRELSPHDAWEAARTVVGVVVPATGRKVAVDLDLQGDGVIDCVPEELNQVFTNLIQNAVEAVPEETGRVRVSGSADADFLVLRVKDNGPGVAPELQARLFTPFFTTKGPGRGIGLGLTITRRVVQSLGGTIQLSSQPGEGAEFTVRIPRRQRPRDAQPSP